VRGAVAFIRRLGLWGGVEIKLAKKITRTIVGRLVLARIDIRLAKTGIVSSDRLVRTLLSVKATDSVSKWSRKTAVVTLSFLFNHSK